jgi:hypothetical protein
MFGFSKGWLVVGLALFSASMAVAQSARANGATVYVNELAILTFRTSHGGFSPSERAALLARNLEAVFPVNDIRVENVGSAYQVFINDAPLITATPSEAKTLKSSIESVASMWARKLREAVSTPPIQLGAKSLKMANGWVRTVKLTGSATRTAQVQVDREDVVQAKIVKGGVEVRAVGDGQATVTVSGGDAFQSIDVEVRPVAAAFPQSLSVGVVGNPALASTVQGAVETALNHRIAGAPNAKFSFKMPKVEQVPIGASRSYQVSVEATAPGAYPRQGVVTLVVRNIPNTVGSDAELWYDNDPESVKYPQPLFAARLKKNQPSRMLYHHMNAATQAMFMRVQLINDSDETAKVMLMPGDATPDPNPVLAGLLAAEMYVRNWMYGSGEIVVLPPRTTTPISLRRVAPNETMSGLCSLHLVEGPANVLVRSDAYPPFPISGPWVAAMSSPTPWREVGANAVNNYDLGAFQISPHIYPDPQKSEQTWTYRVGGRHQFIRIGEKAIARQDNSGVLDGNFGVFYKIKAEIENPTDKTASVDLQFIPSAGYSGGLFILNGEFMKSPLLQPQSPWRLTRLKLAPGERQVLHLMTIPLSGSSYPATLKIGVTDQVSAVSNID